MQGCVLLTSLAATSSSCCFSVVTPSTELQMPRLCAKSKVATRKKCVVLLLTEDGRETVLRGLRHCPGATPRPRDHCPRRQVSSFFLSFSLSNSSRFELPDGRVITMGRERFEAPEALFTPNLVDVQTPGMSELLFKTIQVLTFLSFVFSHLLLGCRY